METQTDNLSPAARWILKLNAATAYSRLVVAEGASGDELARPALEATSTADLVAGPVVSQDDADALLAGLWLWHDWLPESHAISQSIHTPSGSFWHAILHRREGDFANSKYWYAKVERHPMRAVIGANAASILNPLPADKRFLRLTAGGWDARAFVDLVEQVTAEPGDPIERVVVALQQLEWRVLFDACAHGAVGK